MFHSAVMFRVMQSVFLGLICSQNILLVVEHMLVTAGTYLVILARSCNQVELKCASYQGMFCRYIHVWLKSVSSG